MSVKYRTERQEFEGYGTNRFDVLEAKSGRRYGEVRMSSDRKGRSTWIAVVGRGILAGMDGRPRVFRSMNRAIKALLEAQ